MRVAPKVTALRTPLGGLSWLGVIDKIVVHLKLSPLVGERQPEIALGNFGRERGRGKLHLPY